MIDQPSQSKLSPRDEELATMLETEFPSIWKAALGVADSHRNIALSVNRAVGPPSRFQNETFGLFHL